MEVWHYDGVTARRRHPVVHADAAGLTLSEGDWREGPIAWDTLIARDAPAGERLLGRRDRDGWRLALIGDVPADLARHLPAHERYGRWIDRVGLWPAAGVLAVVAAGVVAVGMAAPGWVAQAVPMAWERRIGDAMLGDFSGRVCAGPAGQAALDRLAGRLDPGGEPLELRVVAIPMVNAAALPGGRIVIFDRLLQDAKSPDEVAGVLAHEIGHVRHRDVLTAMARQAGIGLLLASFTGDVGNTLGTLVAARYSRGAEEAADTYAITALTTVGISPLPTAQFFARLGKMEDALPQMALGYLSSHPLSKTRRTRFEASAKSHRGDTPALSPADWQALRAICTTGKLPVKSDTPFL
ncbi:M48 family metallopeptidase [Sphingomonas sp. RS2018]